MTTLSLRSWRSSGSATYSKAPHIIRRLLTERAVRAAQCGGFDAYSNAGGVVMRDLFQGRRRRLTVGRRAVTFWSRNSSMIEPRRSGSKAGDGSRSRRLRPRATPMVAAGFAASRSRSPKRSRKESTQHSYCRGKACLSSLVSRRATENAMELCHIAGRRSKATQARVPALPRMASLGHDRSFF
jgi:hypothetical protein